MMDENPNIRGKHILIVDDSVQMQRLVRQLVESAGAAGTMFANNGRDALDLMRRGSFDLVIADWRMPEMDGLTFVATLRGDTTKPYSKIPVVMLTGQATVNDVKTAVATGINGYVIKPCSPKALLAQVDKVLA